MEQALSNPGLAGLRKRYRGRFPWLLPVVRLSLETVFWVSGRLLPCVPLIHRRVGLDGEGLGGGYCTPPNQKRCERSELVFRGVWGELKPKVIHR